MVTQSRTARFICVLTDAFTKTYVQAVGFLIQYNPNSLQKLSNPRVARLQNGMRLTLHPMLHCICMYVDVMFAFAFRPK